MKFKRKRHKRRKSYSKSKRKTRVQRSITVPRGGIRL